MDAKLQAEVNEAKQAALAILRHNIHGPFFGLPRTAGWGYPEAYTRDMMISALGILVSGDDELIAGLRRVFLALAENQTPRGHIPSLAHDSLDVGASDTTPLFLLGLALFRRVTGESDFLEDTARKALIWMEYQSPGDHVMVGQLPTSDWRDEQWVLGFGLYVNTVVYTYLRLFNQDDRAAFLDVAARLRRGGAPPADTDLAVLAPAFVVSELRRAFTIGFLVFVPFLVVDLVVSNVLLALGLTQLSPSSIALPFKLLLFVAVDGWKLLARALALSYAG